MNQDAFVILLKRVIAADALLSALFICVERGPIFFKGFPEISVCSRRKGISLWAHKSEVRLIGFVRLPDPIEFLQPDIVVEDERRGISTEGWWNEMRLGQQ